MRPAEFEHLCAILRRRDDGGSNSASARLPNEARGVFADLDALLRQSLEEVTIFAIAQPMQRLDLWRIVETPNWELDAPSLEEAPYSFLPRPPVDIFLVVLDRVEGNKGDSFGAGALLEIFIEQLLPGSGMDACRACNHAIQVEEECFEFAEVDAVRGHVRIVLGKLSQGSTRPASRAVSSVHVRVRDSRAMRGRSGRSHGVVRTREWRR